MVTTMRRATRWLGWAALTGLTACSLTAELDTSYVTACQGDSDCPAGQVCSAEGYCFAEGDAVLDVAVDVDAGDSLDAGELPDAGDTLDPTDAADVTDDEVELDVVECGAEDCREGATCCRCAGAVCGPTETCCGSAAGTWACVDLATAGEHCGACRATCQSAELCEGGACVCRNDESGSSDVCDPAANEQCCGGACEDVTASPAHCGGCGSPCNAGESCTAGVCACNGGAGCGAGVVCCDAGCCAPGELCCGGACRPASDPTCDCGSQPPCAAPEVCCHAGGEFSCADLQTTAANCGACGQSCGTNQVCNEGTCDCTVGFADCDGLQDNGCEAYLGGDASDCGACDVVCDTGEACVGGQCQCPDGAALGAASNCGFCGNACAGTQVCCDATCANLSLDEGHCGACGNACLNGELCCGGTCLDPQADDSNCGFCGNACGPGQACCGGVCQSLLGDPSHCGGCGNLCADGETCCGGSCANVAESESHCGFCGNTCVLGQECCSGSCKALSTDVAHCGGCELACSTTNGTASCTSGSCDISCRLGFASCDNDKTNGCEIAVSSDAANCGACGNLCPGTNGTPSCAAGTCAIACSDGFGNCDGQVANGCETTLATAVLHCGGCQQACSAQNGTPTCAASQCSIACAAGFDDCDQNLTNGCETRLGTSVLHCGACNAACSTNNATPSCVSGACVLTCAPGYRNCDGDLSNGCETALGSDPDNCGACGTVCSRNHGEAGCSGGVCTIACAPDYDDCDGDSGNGCETALQSHALHCGSCAEVCDGTHGTATCSGGACAIACDLGWGDCSGGVVDGCETNTDSNALNCGTCGNPCPSPEVCVASAPGTGSCQSADCPNPTETRCGAACYDLQTAAAHCGACTTDCGAHVNVASSSCGSGECQYTCDAGFGDCTGSVGCETDVTVSVAHCGACGAGCNATNGVPSCAAGACAIACSAGYGNCDDDAGTGCETNTGNSVGHCGACGAACSAANGTPSCAFGACAIACAEGFADCDGDVSNGCEVSTATDLTHCGGCDVVCGGANGLPFCDAGLCGVVCEAGWADCDGDASNGCEVYLATDTANCGTCGVVCSAVNGAATCGGGTCSIACNFGYGDCDADVGTGCEAALTTSLSDCGACGNVCNSVNGVASCDGACQITCDQGFGNCDGSVANGCEAALTSDAAHCGTCTTACNSIHGTATCQSSICGIVCDAGWGDCTGGVANGCETDLTTRTNCAACGVACTGADVCCATGCARLASDEANCGTCGRVCDGSHGVVDCKNGACDVLSCTTGWRDCDGLGTTGCEAELSTDEANCGACGAVCASNHGSGSCVSGICELVCDVGWGDCDGSAANGCETDLNAAGCGGACPCAGTCCPGGECRGVGDTCIYLVEPDCAASGSCTAGQAKTAAQTTCRALGAGWDLCTSVDLCSVSAFDSVTAYLYDGGGGCSCTGGPTACNCTASNIYVHVCDWTNSLFARFSADSTCDGTLGYGCGQSSTQRCGAVVCCHNGGVCP